MIFEILALIVFALHLGLSVFVPFGAFAGFKWPKILWVHFPLATWGILVNLALWTCPLTPLEKYLLHAAGERGYDSGFIEHYIFPLVNFGNFHSQSVALTAGVFVLIVNGIAYGLLFWYWRCRRRSLRNRGEC